MGQLTPNVQETVDRLVRDFALQSHPEGGFYRETYRADQQVQAAAGQPRSASTAIFYLLAGGAYSAWHRIASDEIWHFYAGSPLDIHVLDQGQGQGQTKRPSQDEGQGLDKEQGLNTGLDHDPDKGQSLVTHRLGNPLLNNGTVFQAVVPAGCWFAAELAHAAAYAFVGCTVAPGFEFSEFELGNVADLLQQYPEHASVIARLGCAT